MNNIAKMSPNPNSKVKEREPSNDKLTIEIKNLLKTVKNSRYKGLKIIISEGGASIIDNIGSLTLPNKKFKSIIKKHGLNYKILKNEIIKYYFENLNVKTKKDQIAKY